MALDLFSKEELQIAKKLTLWGLSVVLIVVLFSAVMGFIEMYGQGTEQGIEDTLKKSVDSQIKKSTEKQAVVTGEVPQVLSIPSLSINATIQNPGQASVEVLDSALKRGPVYYSGSGYPGIKNMLIFGHSTGFSVVHNQSYKVFNNIKNGKVGQLVYVRSASGVSTYKITAVKKVSKYNTWIQFESSKPMLTLATCDSFGKASDRWVLEADFVSFVAGK